MRKLSILAILTVTALPTAVRAAPNACSDPLPAWFTAVKAVDDANKKLKSTDTPAGLPDLTLDGSHLDCVKDDVLVINGDTMVNMKPLVTCSTQKICAGGSGAPNCSTDADCANVGGTCTATKPKTDDCKLDYGLAAQRALELLGGTGSWDELVIFGQQVSAKDNAAGPIFYRDGFSPGGPGPVDPVTMMPTTLPAVLGVNEVENIGLGPKMARVMGHPYVGYVAAGGTNQFAKFGDAGSDGWMKKLKKDDFTGAIASLSACGKAPKTATDAPSDQPAAALCFPGFYNFFDALAQASASIYGPYLKGPKDMMGQILSVSAIIGTGNATSSVKGAFVAAQTMPDPMDPTKKVPALDPMTMKPIVIANPAFLSAYPHFWNSFLDTGGSLFAGNTYRSNANGTYETTKPTPFYGINVPFPAGWKAGTVLAGSQVLRFQPLDLYSMGLMSKEELLSTPQLPKDPMTKTSQLKAFFSLNAGAVYRDGRANPPTGFDKVAGPQMGQRTGLVLRPGSADGSSWIKVADILTANGDRNPPYASAPHALKQLWVVVSKPTALIEQDAKDNDDLQMKRAQGVQHQQVVSAARRQFAAYYYMLTQYRGRVVNTIDGVDDNAYYEFGNPDDDKTLFTADSGVEVAMNGWQPASADGWETVNPPGPDMKTVLSFTNVPGNAGVTFAAGKVRIIGDQAGPKAPANAVSVRMRIPVSAAGALKGASASVTIGTLAPVRLPPAPAALVADGAWHTYVAALSSDDYKAGTFDGFSFSPSDKPYTGIPIEVEFIRIAQVPSLKDADNIGVRCSACGGNPLSADAKKKCSALCVGKDETTLVQVPLSDGWVDSEDNCPSVYNPDQADGNGDGVGDACEDFDADGIPNSWDNCPTTTNSRQVDKNGNGVGDVCDGSQTTPCFLKPDSLGGPMSSGPGALLGVLLAGSVGVLVFRRRRRK